VIVHPWKVTTQPTEEIKMLMLNTWKTRPLSPEQTKRMMAIWGAQLERHAKDPVWNELFFCLHADGSGGASLVEASDGDAANQRGLQLCIELGEFLEIETKVVLNQEQAMPAILASMATIGG
jgi:hypothetical protein